MPVKAGIDTTPMLVFNKMFLQEWVGVDVELALGNVLAGVLIGIPVLGNREVVAYPLLLGIHLYAAEPWEE
jgi:hypothetical protein